MTGEAAFALPREDFARREDDANLMNDVATEDMLRICTGKEIPKKILRS